MFDIVTHQMFEITIMILIVANMATMMIEYHDQPQSFTNILEYINYVFVAIFTGEALIKVNQHITCVFIVLIGASPGQNSEAANPASYKRLFGTFLEFHGTLASCPHPSNWAR